MDEWIMRLQAPVCSPELLERCRQLVAPWGLCLSPADIRELEMGRAAALRDTGRVELGEGVLEELVAAFRTSPYITQENFTENLCALQELFYTFKSACREQAADGELIEALRLLFDGPAQGCTELIAGLPWRTMLRIARTGSLA